MSFSKNSKLEVLRTPIEDDESAFAFLYGILRASGEENSETGELEIVTDLVELHPFVNQLIRQYYGVNTELRLERKFNISKTVYHKIIIPPAISDQLMQDTGFLSLQNGSLAKAQGINIYMLQNEACKTAYVKGLFIGCATSSIRISERTPQKTSSGYHLEFYSKERALLTELSSILAEYAIPSKMTQRKSMYVLYFKEAGGVSDVLALVGASEAVIALQEEMVNREIRNKVNRRANCENANLDKTVSAALKHLEAIQFIEDTIGLDSLEEELQEAALIRLANTEESLDELIRLSRLKITKSGLNHRFQKMVKIAAKLKEELAEEGK